MRSKNRDSAEEQGKGKQKESACAYSHQQAETIAGSCEWKA